MAWQPEHAGLRALVTISKRFGTASGRWVDIISSVGGISRDILGGGSREHPCPKCGGNTRFRMIDTAAGAVFCSHCFNSRNGDGFAAIQWARDNVKFSEALKLVAEYLAVPPDSKWSSKPGSAKKPDPAKDLEFKPWNEMLAGIWCINKKGIKLHAILQVGGQLAIYQNQYPVIAIPVLGPQLRKAKPVGWVVFRTNGGTLPSKKDGEVSLSKMKSTYGTEPGLIGVVRDGQRAWKTEGPSDLLAMLSLNDFPQDVTVVCNAMGATENPEKSPWIAKLFAGKDVGVIHDCDDPGQKGAMGWKRPDGSFRPGWCQAIAAEADLCRNVLLPFPIMPDHGKDLRDFAAAGGTYAGLLELATKAAVIDKPTSTEIKPIEADDDPHRLARVNLERFRKLTDGGVLRYWQGQWFKWEPATRCYRTIEPLELRARLNSSIKAEFDRISINRQAENEKDSTARRVTRELVSNTLEAMAGECVIPNSVKINSWINYRGNCEMQNRYIAMRNGLFDLTRYMQEQGDHLLPHTPDWFSTVCLPYEFNEQAECPIWHDYLSFAMGGDPEKIAILQEWAGYLLTSSTDRQKMMFFEGEGGNGKNVYMAAIEAMLGEGNCSHLGLEMFGQPFMTAQMIGKLLNISSECSEMDSVCEGVLKAMASGDRMTINRKGISPIEITPTARILVSANVRPRFADKSSGLWCRLILIPWTVRVPEWKIVEGMDKTEWWRNSGELPGIFNWAIAGLHRLNEQGRFTKSSASDKAMEDYRLDVNPTKMFLKESCVEDNNKDVAITCSYLYDTYKQWSLDNGYRIVSDRTFGREVKRQFPKSERKRARDLKKRFYVYSHLKFGNPEDEEADEFEQQTQEIQKELDY